MKIDKHIEEVLERFLYHDVTESCQKIMIEVRKEFHKIAKIILHLIPEGREKAMALTKLEESLMHSMASLARKHEGNKPQELGK